MNDFNIKCHICQNYLEIYNYSLTSQNTGLRCLNMECNENDTGYIISHIEISNKTNLPTYYVINFPSREMLLA